jgi:hypothetical protein
MVKVLFDTHILIDYLNGIPQARDEIARYSDKAISLITWMEVLVGATPQTEIAIKSFLNDFLTLAIDKTVSEIAVNIRQRRKVKLPDAIVWATALANGRILVSRNTKNFASDEPGVRVPYIL